MTHSYNPSNLNELNPSVSGDQFHYPSQYTQNYDLSNAVNFYNLQNSHCAVYPLLQTPVTAQDLLLNPFFFIPPQISEVTYLDNLPVPVTTSQPIRHDFTSNYSNVHPCNSQQNKDLNDQVSWRLNRTEDDKMIRFKSGETFLDFTLRNTSDLEISEQDKRVYNISKPKSQKPEHFSRTFSKTLDSWIWTPPDRKTLDAAAKCVILIACDFGYKGFKPIQKIFEIRFTDHNLDVTRKMILLYLVHLIMAMETLNPYSRCGPGRPLCKIFEIMFSNLRADVFRRLVLESTSVKQRQEMYSLKCKWESYFSEDGIKAIDRDRFWEQEIPGTSLSVKYSQTAPQTSCSQNEANTMPVEGNNIISEILKQTIDEFLCEDWVDEFPMDEKDKRRFTEKYSVNKPSVKDGHVVSLYNKKIEFCPKKMKHSIVMLTPCTGKEKYVDVAKEMFYIENVFGKNKALLIAEIISEQWDEYTSEFEAWAMTNQLKTLLLLVHIILYAEATQSPYKDTHKMARPFSCAFATDEFVLKFRKLVRCQENKYKPQLWWMRLRWNLCFLEEYLYKIDANEFWRSNGVTQTELPPYLRRKKKSVVNELSSENCEEVSIIAHIDKNTKKGEVAVILLEFSEDEENEDKKDEDKIQVVENRVEIPKKNYLTSFMANRCNEWTTCFIMDENCTTKIRQKYNYSGCCKVDAKGNRVSVDEFAGELFRITFVEAFPWANEQILLNLAKEAFFVQGEFGYGVVHNIVKFLVDIMQEGFKFCKSPESKMVSQLLAFLTVHIINAIESVEPSIVPENITERYYIKAVEHYDGFSSVKKLITSIEEEQELKSTLKFLTLTWTIRDDSRISARTNAKYKSNQKLEIVLIRSVIENIKRKCENNREIEKDKLAASKRCKRKLEEIDNEIAIIYETESPAPKKMTQKKIETEELMGEKTKDLQRIFVPSDTIEIIQIPSATKDKGKTSENVNQGYDSELLSKTGSNRYSTSSTNSGLVGVNEQPLRQEGNTNAKQRMEEIRKLMRERQEKIRNLVRKKKGLLGVSGQPLRQEESESDKAMEQIKKLMRERREKIRKLVREKNGLLGVSGQPLRQEESESEKAMEQIKKLMRERQEKVRELVREKNGLLRVGMQTLRQDESKSDKAMEEIKKLMQERREKIRKLVREKNGLLKVNEQPLRHEEIKSKKAMEEIKSEKAMEEIKKNC